MPKPKRRQPALNLSFPAILSLFGDYKMKGRNESKALLAWFLESYYHLDETEVDDSICDEEGDKGVDGIYVNELRRRIDVFQSEIGTKTPVQQLGDGSLKHFAASLLQFRTVDTVKHMTATTRSTKLQNLLEDLEVAERIAMNYTVRGIFVTNKTRNSDSTDFLAVSPDITLYDNQELDAHYLPIDKTEPIAKPISFNVANVQVLQHTIERNLKMMIAPLAASELVKMEGIVNLELFTYNLRYDLKNSSVNRAIETSVNEPAEHRYFPAFHNGLTVLCKTLGLRRKKIRISGYAVVNGCQSLTALYYNQTSITPDLRILTKFIQVSPESNLAQKITDRTNNQNAITGRDRQSNSDIQTRIQSAIHREYPNEVFYRIARGEHPEWDPKRVIENEQMARVLLAFDLRQPESCHQHYKLFGDLHSDIFGRPDVTADRIVILNDIDQIVLAKRGLMRDKLFAHYSLTRFLFHYLLREALETDMLGVSFCKEPSVFMTTSKSRARLRSCIEPIVAALMRFMDAYMKQHPYFDYKKGLKSKNTISDLRTFVIPFYQITIDSGGDLKSFSDQWQASEASFQ